MTALFNKRIVVTRARHQAADLENLIRKQGAVPIPYPCIAIVPPGDTTALDAWLASLNEFDWLLLTSANTVQALSERLTRLDLRPDWTKIKIAAVGRKTGAELGVMLAAAADFIPPAFTAECLANTLPLTVGSRLFLPQSTLADERVADILRTRGAEVITAVAYHTAVGRGGADVPAMLQRNEIDALTFASPSALKYFVQRSQLDRMPDLPVVCIGPSTVQRAVEIGFQQALAPQEYSLRGMIHALVDYYSTCQKSVS